MSIFILEPWKNKWIKKKTIWPLDPQLTHILTTKNSLFDEGKKKISREPLSSKCRKTNLLPQDNVAAR